MSGGDSSWTTAIRVGDRVNMMVDSVWRVAKVLAITESQFRCECIQQINGRTRREFIRKTSERLAPAGTKCAIPAAQPAAQPQPAAPEQAVAAAPLLPEANAAAMPFAGSELMNHFGATLSVNDKCDCKDNNKWRSSTVIGARADELHIHFDGWDSRWDEWVPRRARRLQPHNSQTGGQFTGDPKRNQQPQQNIPAGFFDPVVVDNSHKNWKRVLSHGMGDPQVKMLDSIFDTACKLQDVQRNIVLGRQYDSEKLQKDLSEFEAEVARAAASGALPAHASGYLQACKTIIRDIHSTLEETLRVKRRQALQSKEDLYFRKLQKQFYFVTIPSDGNCLFGAAGRGMKFGKQLSECQHDGEVKKHVDLARRINSEESSTIATDYRLQAVMRLQGDEKYAGRVGLELKHAVQTASTGKGNPTSKTLLEQMRVAFPGEDLMSAAETKKAIGIYCQVMMSPRVFGTELEAQALSEVLQAPLHIFYRVSKECANQEQGEFKATNIIGQEFEDLNPPVCLAFYMGKSHYDLLIKRHPSPDPMEVKRKEDRIRNRKENGFQKYRLVFTQCRGGPNENLRLRSIKFFKYSKKIDIGPPGHPGGHSPSDMGPSCLIDGSEKTSLIDLNFSKNKKSVLVFKFKEPMVVTEYELEYSKQNPASDPTSWEIYGDTKEDGLVLLDKQSDLKARDGSVGGKIDYFVKPKPKDEEKNKAEKSAKEQREGAVDNSSEAAGAEAKKDPSGEKKSNESESGGGATQETDAAELEQGVDRNNNQDAAPKAKQIDGESSNQEEEKKQKDKGETPAGAAMDTDTSAVDEAEPGAEAKAKSGEGMSKKEEELKGGEKPNTDGGEELGLNPT